VVEGGKRIQADAPLSKLPLFVKAGSIVPFGPAMEWATQKTEDPIELRVYPGADGDFTLYEDENDGYAYEKGAHATIAMHWDDRGKTLTIGAREGSFPGMLKERTFSVDVVGGTSKAVKYVGEKVAVKP
jgi:alpha-D-xyloside xylohydrolase